MSEFMEDWAEEARSAAWDADIEYVRVAGDWYDANVVPDARYEEE